ncbi:MAG: hypothetical protein AB1413_00205 [Thermodesulfobacteriota bacterium]
MALPLFNRRLFTLTSSENACFFGEVTRSAVGTPALTIHARTDTPITSEVAAPRLLSTISTLRGEVSLAVPLHFLEIVAIALPAMPDGAVGKALPYHLAKAVSRPLSDYIYDWQIVERHRDRLQVTVYLFPAARFQSLRAEFARKHLTIKYMEADVFAAFALLARENRLRPDTATLCALIWNNSISLAVYEKNLLTLVRTVSATKPQGAPTPGHGEEPSRPPAPLTESTAPATRHPLDSGEEDSLLAGFDILSGATAAPSPAAPDDAPPMDTSWADYLQHIGLEIMRTRDYYASVVKGGAIKRAVVGGAEAFWPALQRWGRTSLELELEPLTTLPETADCPPMLQAIAIGTGTRG